MILRTGSEQKEMTFTVISDRQKHVLNASLYLIVVYYFSGCFVVKKYSMTGRCL